MKRLFVCFAAMIFAVAVLAWARLQDSTAKRDRIMGTWQLVSADYSGQPGPPSGKTQVKMISNKRFMWIQYDSAKNKTLESGFGTYVFTGDSYTEHIELLDANGQGDAYLGKDLTFTVRIEGDTLTQTGLLGQMKLSETWKRME